MDIWKFGRHHKGDIWKADPHHLMWCIWQERNNWSFEDLERTLPDQNFFSLELYWIGCQQ